MAGAYNYLGFKTNLKGCYRQKAERHHIKRNYYTVENLTSPMIQFGIMKTDYPKHPLEKKLKIMIQQDSFLFDKVTNEQIAGMLFQDLSKPDVEWISPAFWRSLGMNPAVKKHLATEWQAHLYEADRRLISKVGNHADSILLRFYRQDRTLFWFKCHIHIYDEAQKSSPGYRLILLIKSTVHDEKNSIPMVSDIGIISTPFKSDEAIFHMDQTLCIQKMNPIGEKLTGKMESEARGKPLDTILTLLEDSSGETVALPVDFYLYEHQSRMQKLSLSAVSKENIKHPVSVFGSQIWDESGDPKGSILILKIKSRKDLFQYLILSRYSLIRYAKNHRLDELLKKALDELGEIVNSPIGFYHFVSPDQKTLVLQQWSSRTLDEFCNINGGDMHYSIDKAGVWVDCVHQKKPVIHNNYASLENKKGLPQNHAPITRELVVPVIRDGNVVAVLGVGNKPVYYNSEDAEIVSYFADVTWEIVRQKQVEEQIALQKNIDQELADLSTLLLTQTTLEEISENVLETAKKLTKSRYGYVGTYDSEKKFLINHTMTRDVWEKCDVPNKSIVFEKCTGLFGWVIDNQQPLMLNSINADDPRSCGTPEGHIKIEAFLCVPAMIDGELAGQIALANPENQYLDIDLKIVQRLANLFALAIQRQNYHDHLLEMESRKAKDLEKTVEQRTRELMASRNLLEKIFTSQLDAILVLDTATPPCIIDANPSTIRMFGYSKTDLIGQTTALFHCSTDKNALFWETIAAHVERDREFYLDSHDLQKKNGSMLSVRVSATRMRGSGNGITGWILVIHDNSEEKRYQDSLKRNEEKFRAIADYTLDWEGWLDPEGRFLWLNPAAEKITGYTIQEYMSARNLEDWISMLFIAGYSEEAAAVFHQVLRHKESVNDRHFKIRKKDGEDCWVSLSCRPIYSGSGIYFGIRTSIRDITERKKVERQVFLSEQRLQLAMESIRDGVWDWRLDTGEAYFSSRWYTMLGYDPNEMPPSYDTWKQLTHPEDIDTCEQIIRSALESGNPFEMEFRMRTREGQWKWILARGRAFEKDTQGKPLRMLGTHMDMTQRKLMESNMRQSQKMEAMGTLAGGIAHDFNNILAGIIGYAELVLDEVDPDSRACTRLNGIINSSERARELISQILTFSRKEEKEIQPVDIRLITREALS